METKSKAEVKTYLDKILDIETRHKAELQVFNDKYVSFHSNQNDVISDIETRHKAEIKTHLDRISDMEAAHEQEKLDMSETLRQAQAIVSKMSKKTSVFQKAEVILACFIGVVAYQSYETSLGLKKFHFIAGQTVPYAVAIGCAALVGLFGIILTMNMPKDEYDNYDIKPLRNYEIAVFLFNTYLFVPDVWKSNTTAFYDVLATLVYCGLFPFIELTFGKVYLSKKQQQEALENECLNHKIA
jgi:hypothetical protein